MNDIKEKALNAVVNRPSFLVMVVGSIQLVGVLYVIGYKLPDVPAEFRFFAMCLLSATFIVGCLFLSAGMALMFYGTKKDAEQKEKRLKAPPRVKITKGQQAVCGRFPKWTNWVDAVMINGKDRKREMVVSYNLGKTQRLMQIEVNNGVRQVRSINQRE